MKKAIICKSEKNSFADLAYVSIFSAAALVFLYAAFSHYTKVLFEDCLIIPCVLFWGAILERMGSRINKRSLILPGAMVVWFLLLQIRRGMELSDTDNIGLFIATYLFSYPLASVLLDREKASLKIFAGAYLAAAAVLAFLGLILVFDVMPDFLSQHIYWDGPRIYLFWHPNVAATLLMIGIVFCSAFMAQAKQVSSKIAFLVLLALMIGIQALTNCRTAIILTGGYLGATLFFALIKRGRKWFLPGVLSVLVVTVAVFEGAGYLYQVNNDRLVNQYIQQQSEQASHEEESQSQETEETIPVWVNAESGEVSLITESAQGSILSDLGTLNSRTRIWNAALYAIRETPSILYWGMPNPGWYVSYYLDFEIAHLHNAWLQAFVGMGLIGFLITVLFTLTTAWNCLIILIRYNGDVWKRSIAILSLCLMAAGMLEPYLFYTSGQYHLTDLLFFLCAGYLAYWQEEDNHRILAAIRGRIPFLKK